MAQLHQQAVALDAVHNRIMCDASSDVVKQGRRPQEMAVNGISPFYNVTQSGSRICNGETVFDPSGSLSEFSQKRYGFIARKHLSVTPT